MRNFYTLVVRRRWIIIAAFILAAAVCLFLNQLVAVNYDMTDYLPPDSPSTIALDVMQQEFDGGIPDARVMVRNVTIPQALAYKEALKQVDGVLEVMWLDDAVDITLPLEILDEETVDAYYQEGAALFTVTIDEDKRLQAVADIRTLIGDENAMTGSAVSTAIATTSTVSEIAKIAAFVVLFVLVVLLITTKSWLEPLVVLGGLGVAIAINGGTNLIFGEISFVTNAAGNILQLAVSLDYSVFLLHRFEECREEQPDLETAMVDALCKSTGSILSSGLTTVIGFLALVLMRFQIGPDLGLALAKGVALSLITVFVFMPALILAVHRLLDKTRHRTILPNFSKFGRVVRRVMLPMTAIFAIVIVPSYLASTANSYYYGAGHMFGPDTQLGADTASIEDAFGKSDTYVLLVPNDSTARQKALSDELHTIPEIKSIVSYVDMAGAEIPMDYLDPDTLSQLVSEHYSRMVLTVEADYEGEDTFRLVSEIRAVAESHYPGQWHLAGEGVSTYDLMNTVTRDMVKVNLVAILAVFAVLLALLRSAVLPVILVLSIETAIWLNLSLPYFTDSYVFYIAYLIISSIQLGATVDYAILLSDRYREFRQTMDKNQAVVETVSAVTVSILTSGSVLSVAGFLLGAISSNGLLAQLGTFLGVGAICSLVIVLFVLPGLLYLFDKLFLPKKKRTPVTIQ
ncbi:MAG: MMPL family transporter [Firmicutes bacterium]|jgi:predicted RND superfamily exporter protein|nr:MMPL family transporter [Bacillota bacterium]